MKIIHKKMITLGKNFYLELPVYAKILSFKIQNGTPCIWYEFFLGQQEKIVQRKFHVFATGEEFESNNLQFIETVMDEYGYVWHLYEELV